MVRAFSLLFTIFLIFVNTGIHARLLPDKFTRITVEHGLSQRTAWTIVQDKYGFIWIGTQDGLNRFNGLNFKIFDSQNCPILKSSAINDLMIEENGDLIICTSKGIYRYNYIKDDIEALKIFPNIEYRDIIRDSFKNYWVASDSGLFFYNIANDKIKQFTSNLMTPNSLNTNDIDCILEDKKHHIWVGTMSGLNLLNPTDSSFFNIDDITGRLILKDKRIANLSNADSSSILISISDLQGGLELFYYDKNEPYKGKLIELEKGNSSKSYIDSYNRLWMGFGAGEGLKVLYPFTGDRNGSVIKTYKHEATDPFSLSDNTIADIFEDQWGDRWISTFGNGLNYLSFKRKNYYNVHHEPYGLNTLSNNIVNCFLEEDKYLWVGTESGLNRIDKKTGIIKQYKYNPTDATSISANAIYALYKDSNGNLWIGTWNGGLNRYIYNSDQFKSYKHDVNNKTSISSNNIFSILEDKRGNLWIGTIGGGLNLYDYKTNQFKHFMANPNDPASIGGDYIDHIVQTRNGELWISSYRELNKYDYTANSFIKYRHQPGNDQSLSSGDIEVIYEDGRNNLWIGTAGGLCYFNRENNTCRRFTTKDGLPNNYVQSIIEDQTGNLWLGTNKGLSKFIDGTLLNESATFQNFTDADGIQGLEFVKRSSYRDSKGYLYFGGTNGYTYFYPDSIKNITYKNPLLITDLLLFNKSVKPGDQSGILTENIVNAKKLVFSYRQSVFTIEFTALNYLNPTKNSYAYMLDNFEKDWNYVGSRRYATYTNLPPGNYLFKVKATNSDGIWDNNLKTLEILILPPWWKTIWFRVFAVILIILFGILAYQLRFHRLERQKKKLEKLVNERTNELSELNALLEESKEEVSMQNEELILHRNQLEKLVDERTAELRNALKKAEDLDKLKTSFLANMSHEIRTPMNAIIGFSNMLNNEELEKDEKEFFIKTIHNNGNSLLVLINDILEISQIESNQLAIKKTIFNATEILEELKSFYSINNKTSVNLRIEEKYKGKDLYLDNDSVRFKQVLTNLLSNAFKYTEEGKIELTFKIQENQIIFCVEDSGIGIKKENQDRIFERFYKIEENEEVLYRGTGLGLAISKSLIKLMGGTIWVESEFKKGSKFFFTLPYSVSNQPKLKNEDKNDFLHAFKDLTILIVEDEETNFWLLERMLNRKNINVHWAENGQIAINFIRLFKPLDKLLVLMDIKMPVMDGYEAIKIIRHEFPKLQVIAVTAYARNEEKEKILKSGFTDYLPKPISEQQLFDLINKHRKQK